MGRPTAVERDLLGDIMIADRFLEEAYGGRLISILTQQEIDSLAMLIDRAVEIAPLVLHFDAGFILLKEHWVQVLSKQLGTYPGS